VVEQSGGDVVCDGGGKMKRWGERGRGRWLEERGYERVGSTS
jgi:hypothetical protein